LSGLAPFYPFLILTAGRSSPFLKGLFFSAARFSFWLWPHWRNIPCQGPPWFCFPFWLWAAAELIGRPCPLLCPFPVFFFFLIWPIHFRTRPLFGVPASLCPTPEFYRFPAIYTTPPCSPQGNKLGRALVVFGQRSILIATNGSFQAPNPWGFWLGG